MKKIATLLLYTTLMSFGCDNESIEPIDNKIEEFKTQTVVQFQGRVLNDDIYWKFDNWDTGIGAYSESFWCVAEDKTIQQRNFSIYDYEKRENITLIKVISPAFSISDIYENKKSIFDVGKKEFQLEHNSIYEGFIVQGNTKDICFSTKYGPQNESSFEVVKLQELPPDPSEQRDFKKIRTWIVITCTLYECSGEKVGRIENGQFITEIEIERNE